VGKWQLLKDVLLTGTAIAVILSQVFSRHPSEILLVTGLALTVPSVAGHAGALIASGGKHGRTGGESSPPPAPSGALPSGSSPGGTE
jgi:hypothetical protein